MRRFWILALLFPLCSLVAPACRPAPAPPEELSAGGPVLATTPPERSVESFVATGPTFVDPAPRILAIGDLHGDLAAARAALKLGGAIDDEDRWSGGELVVVQTGDQIDRGDDDRAVLDLFAALAGEAAAAGGAVYSLTANHEVMNAELQFDHATDGGIAAFADVVADPADRRLARLDPSRHGRAAAFLPGGPYARQLALRNVVLVVGDVVFVHGGVLPEHVGLGLGWINAQTQAWLRGDRDHPSFLGGNDSPTWARHYSNGPDEADCALLDEALAAIPARTMVVGHTVQDEINAACDGKVWRIDVGMARHYGGTPAALEIVAGQGFEVLGGAAVTPGASGPTSSSQDGSSSTH